MVGCTGIQVLGGHSFKYYSGLRRSTLEFPWDLGIKSWGLSHTGGRSIIALIVVWCIHVNARGVTEN